TVQGLCETAEAFRQHGRDAYWHLIGRLQRNKVNKALAHASMIHTVDREELAEALNKRATPRLPVLVQVNLGEEPQKGGVEPSEAEQAMLSNLKIRDFAIRGRGFCARGGQTAAPAIERADGNAAIRGGSEALL
ncbi:alanine racemase, partial [Myxococcota bacterium]